jgi:uncharacterized repeat protein (TIGR01451 family)
MRRRVLVGALCALAAPLALGIYGLGSSVGAQEPATCDSLTGGGFVYPTGAPAGGKGTFGVAGGCKNGSFWGHLEYHDHGNGVSVHGLTVTGYLVDPSDPFARFICGTGRTSSGDVLYLVRAKDGGPGADEFDITLEGAVMYSTVATGSHVLGGGSIVLHKPNRSNTGEFGGSCPLLAPPPQGAPDVAVLKTADPPAAPVASFATFTIMVMANGSSASTNVTLTDVLQPRPPGNSWTISGEMAGCSIGPVGADLVLSCSFGTMAAGTSRTIFLTTTADVSDVAGINNTATVASTNDSEPGNNISGPVTITVPAPE